MCRCAAKWDAMEMNYSEKWDEKRRETKGFEKRTKAIRFLFEVGGGLFVCCRTDHGAASGPWRA